MAAIDEITPKHSQRIIDLVRAAGVNVDAWSNFAGGAEKAASNPKYCYEWSFIEPERLVVLNLWLKSMRIANETIIQKLNLRERAHRTNRAPNTAVWEKRARSMDLAIQIACRESLPIRVVVCDGQMRDASDLAAKASRVTKRLLDPAPWAVAAYDWNSGECTLIRVGKQFFVDQFAGNSAKWLLRRVLLPAMNSDVGLSAAKERFHGL
ncbi:MAG TPA: hypothetical protein VHX61_13775 [Rhizomicrobium sp.]|jgi:5-methylcytosine-specific restriction protein A|nr:hypothetical protein [Rhizomicrobium sp.]